MVKNQRQLSLIRKKDYSGTLLRKIEKDIINMDDSITMFFKGIDLFDKILGSLNLYKKLRIADSYRTYIYLPG